MGVLDIMLMINKKFVNNFIPMDCTSIETYHTINPVDDLSYMSFEEILKLNQKTETEPEAIFFA